MRARAPNLLAEGRLDRSLRAIARANVLCPATAPETWAVEVATLVEVGDLLAAKELARTIAAAASAPDLAKRAALKADEDAKRLEALPVASAKEGAKKLYAEAADAFLRRDWAAAERSALAASSTYHPNPEALALAGMAASAGGDQKEARRSYDRALVELRDAERCSPGGAGLAIDDYCPLLARPPANILDDAFALAFSPAAGLAALDAAGYVHLVDTEGRYRSILKGTSSSHPAFSPDGRRLVMLLSDQGNSGAAVYDSTTGLLVQKLPDLPTSPRISSLYNLCVSPDGTKVAGAVNAEPPRSLIMWDLAHGKQLFSVPIPAMAIWMGFTGDGRSLVLRHGVSGQLGGETSVRLYDARTGRTVRRLPGDEGALPTSESLATSPDGASIAAVFNGDLHLVNVATGKDRLTFEQGGFNKAGSIVFSPDGKLVAGAEKVVDVWSAETGKHVARFAPELAVQHTAFIDATHLLTYGKDRFTTWEIGASIPRRSFGGPVAEQLATAFSPHGFPLASALDDGTIALWDPASAPVLRRLRGHAGPVRALAFSRDGARLLSSSEDRTVRLWDVGTGQILRTFTGHGAAVTAVTFSPDETMIASSSADKTARTWDAASGAEIRTLGGHPTEVLTVAFSADGETIATGSKDGKVRLFDAKSDAAKRTIEVADTPAYSVVFARPAELLVMSGSGSLTRWSTATGTLIRAASGEHGFPLTRGALSADGKLVAATGYSYSNVVLVDSQTLAPVRTLKSKSSDVYEDAAFSSDGRFVAVPSRSGALTLWRTDSDAPWLSLRVAPGLDAGMASTPDGYVDFFGADAAVLRRLTRCVIGQRELPLEVCAERFEAPGLLAKVVANDTSFREP